MRVRLLTGLVALALGCGEGTAVKGAEPAVAPHIAKPVEPPPGLLVASLSPATETGTATTTPNSTTPLPASGHLDGWANLGHLFEALAAIDEGKAHDDVRILQFGDSHTACDVGTGTFRHMLQSRFGDGGRGFVAIGRPWKTYYQEGTRGGMAGDFEPARITFKEGRYRGDGRYGLLGIGVRASAGGSRAWTEVRTPFSHFEIEYWQQPGGGSFDVLIDGAKVARVNTAASTEASGYYALDVAEAPHQIELSTLNSGEVRVFGMTLDNARAGVVVDSLGVNGAQVTSLLRENEDQFVDQLRHRAPDLVVLAYGTNEALDPDLSDADFERHVVDELGRIEKAAPNASCLLLGPPDLAKHVTTAGKKEWKTWPRVQEIAADERKVASAAKCAFYDQLAAMGGPGSMLTWVNEHDSRASSDHVHMRKAGYEQLGAGFATDLMHAYDEWRAARGLPPTSAPPTWVVGAR
jgi:lysophospholipase L1-like esterase